MKGNIFGAWLKEFCSLVFTQAVQAFLLAIIMSIVVSTASSTQQIEENMGSAVSATGIIAIIALTSISKVEMLVKNLFGIKSQYADPSMSAGRGALAKSYVALTLGKKVLDNGKKFTGGISDIAKSKSEQLDAKRDYADSLSRIYRRNNPNSAAQEAATNPNGNNTQGGGTPTTTNSIIQTGGTQTPVNSNPQNGGAQSTVSSSTSSSGTNTGNGDNNNTDSGNNNAQANIRRATLSEKDEEKLINAKKAYDKAMKAAKEKRNKGIKSVFSGVAETGAASVGAVIGGAYGAADGEDAIKSMIAGMGAGDIVGSSIVNLGGSAIHTVGSVKSHYKKQGDAADAMEKAMERYSEVTGKETKKLKKDISTKINTVRYRDRKQAMDDVIKQIGKEIDAGDL